MPVVDYLQPQLGVTPAADQKKEFISSATLLNYPTNTTIITKKIETPPKKESFMVCRSNFANPFTIGKRYTNISWLFIVLNVKNRLLNFI